MGKGLPKPAIFWQILGNLGYGYRNLLFCEFFELRLVEGCGAEVRVQRIKGLELF